MLKTGDLAFYHQKDLLARMIQWRTKSEWNHVGVIFVGWGHAWLVQSTIRKGAHMILLRDRKPDRILPAPGVILPTARSWAFSQFDEGYSIADALRAGFGRRTNNPGWICSEFVAEILRRSDIPVPEWGVTPEALYAAFRR